MESSESGSGMVKKNDAQKGQLQGVAESARIERERERERVEEKHGRSGFGT